MRSRWRLLFWIALGSLIGLSWVAQRMGMSSLGFMTIPFIGMVVGAAIAFGAMLQSYPQKWPAAAVLVCALPMALDLLRALSVLPWFITTIGAPAILFIGGAVGTFGVAAWILAIPIAKPPVVDPIARAEVR